MGVFWGVEKERCWRGWEEFQIVSGCGWLNGSTLDDWLFEYDQGHPHKAQPGCARNVSKSRGQRALSRIKLLFLLNEPAKDLNIDIHTSTFQQVSEMEAFADLFVYIIIYIYIYMSRRL